MKTETRYPGTWLQQWMGGRGTWIASVSLGLLAALLAFLSLRSREEEVRAGWELVSVLVASGDLPAGSTVDAGTLARRPIPERFVTASVVKPEHLSLVIGQKLRAPLRSGDPILWTHFDTAEGPDGLAGVVRRRGRAVTVALGESGSVGGWVRPNDHVDVLGTFRDPSTHEMTTVTLLQNVVVLATGTEAGRFGGAGEGARTFGNVSLLVLPEEAEMLILAQELGSLSLALRHPEDTEVAVERSRATISTLLTGERSRELQRLRHETIQVIRGGAEGLR